mmetsp:Transcript_13441/g.15846  ORF Transcript_13441/g.15846 Transcript_13441/m.15846 type:complete len:176 (-) Transcript_13441:70-597(-)
MKAELPLAYTVQALTGTGDQVPCLRGPIQFLGLGLALPKILMLPNRHEAETNIKLTVLKAYMPVVVVAASMEHKDMLAIAVQYKTLLPDIPTLLEPQVILHPNRYQDILHGLALSHTHGPVLILLMLATDPFELNIFYVFEHMNRMSTRIVQITTTFYAWGYSALALVYIPQCTI